MRIVETPFMQPPKVGIREFRADLAEYISAETPIAITRHGQTVGYFIPAQGHAAADIAALKQASQALDRLLAENGVDVDDVVADFKAARRQGRANKKPRTKTA